MAKKEYNVDLDIKGKVLATDVPNSTGSIVTWNSTSKVFGLRTNAQIISDLNLSSSFVPYTGATANVNLGARSITSTGGFIGNASTATKLASIITTFTGTYPVTFNVNGTIYSHTGLTYTGSTGALAATTFIGALSGNATTATTLATSRTINGTSFNGSANITTANWGTARNIKIGDTTKSVNGSGNVSWSLAEIGAASSTALSNYVPLSGTEVGKPLTGYIEVDVTNDRVGFYSENNDRFVGITDDGFNSLVAEDSSGYSYLEQYPGGNDLVTSNNNSQYSAIRISPTSILLNNTDNEGNRGFSGELSINNYQFRFDSKTEHGAEFDGSLWYNAEDGLFVQNNKDGYGVFSEYGLSGRLNNKDYSLSKHYSDSGNSNLLFPDSGNTGRRIPVSVNGVYADSSGDIGISLPTVNNGQLTLSTGTGLSGSATFTANQSGSSTFSVAVASTHKLPTTAEWNALSTQTLSNSTSNLIVSNTVQRAALTGDVTASQNSNATTIANSAVTHAKYQNIATQRILGRGATGTGNVQELTLGANLSLSTSGVLSSSNTTYSAGTLELLQVGTNTTNRVWSPKILADYVLEMTPGTSNFLKKNSTNKVTQDFTLEYDFNTPAIDPRTSSIYNIIDHVDNKESLNLRVRDDNGEGFVMSIKNDRVRFYSKEGDSTYIDIDGNKINNLKLRGGGLISSTLTTISGNNLSNFVFADVSNKDGLGTFRVQNNLFKDNIPVFAQNGASILAQSGGGMFTLSAHPNTPEVFVSAGNTTNNVNWNKKLAFSINNFTITATAFYESSLKKFKTNIKPFNKSGIELINSLDIVTFDRIDDKTKNKIGIIADHTKKEFLSEDKDAVDLYKTIFIQAKAIQELEKKNQSLEERLTKLEIMLENL